jgi:bifunctional non-homologous end joining protein LigD
MRPGDIDHDDFMHATLLQRPFTRPGWSFEMKLDKFRALAGRDGDLVELISRNGNTLGPAFPEVVRALKTVPGNWVLDAELVVPNSKGRPSFERVRRRAVLKLTKTIVDAVTKAPAALCVFDVLYARNSDVRVLPLAERRELLHELVKSRPGLQVITAIEEHGESVFAKA